MLIKYINNINKVYINKVFEFIIKYPLHTVVGILLTILIAVITYKREALKRKIQQETISFVAMVFSVSMALISFFSKPQAIPTGTLALVNGGRIGMAFPVTIILVILAITSIIIFFRKELAE